MYKPAFGKRLLSYLWPIRIEKLKGHSDHVLEVIVYHGKVMLDTEKSIGELLSFYMGKNTPERQKFIIDNLKVELDLIDPVKPS